MLKKLIQNLFWIIVFSCTSHSSLFWTYFQLYVHITWPESNLNPNLHICGLFDTSLGLCVMEIIQNSTRMWGPKGKNMFPKWFVHENMRRFCISNLKSLFFFTLLIITQHQWGFSSPNQIWGNLPPSLKVFSWWRPWRKGILSPQWDYKNAAWGMSQSRQHVTILKIHNPGELTHLRTLHDAGVMALKPRCE